MQMTATAGKPLLPLAGRVLIGVLFMTAGIRKFLGVAGSAKYFAALGFPMPEVMVWVAIAVEVVGGLLLIIGWKTRWVAWLLILFVAIATGMAHRFWEFPEAQFNAQLNNFLKNIAIIGGLLFVAAFGPGRASVDKA